MSNALPVLLLLLIAGVEALATGKAIYYNLACSLLGISLVSFFWAWYNVNYVQIERETLSPHAQVGKVAEERFVLRNRGLLPKLWLEVRDHSDLPDHRAGMVISSLGPRRQRGWAVRTACTRRGRYRLGPLTLISSDPFGLFTCRQKLVATSSIVVYPLVVYLTQFGRLTGALNGGNARPQRTHYVTTDVAGVREYYPGDTFNRIHWPSTARKDQLIVKEFELDPAGDVWLFVDMEEAVQVERARPDSQQVTAPAAGQCPVLEPATEEYVVAAAATLAVHFWEHGRAVGLVAHGLHREVVQPERGERQLTKLLETLAVIRARGHVPFAQLLSLETASLSRNAAVIAVTPSSDVAWAYALRALGRCPLRCAAVVVDPASFGAAHSAVPVLQTLIQAGVPSFRIREGEALASALATPVAAA